MGMTIKGLKTFVNKLTDLQDTQLLRDALAEKQDWLENKSDSFKESDKGQEWEDFLYSIETMLDELENIEIPDLD